MEIIRGKLGMDNNKWEKSNMKWAYLIHLGQKMWIKTNKHSDNFRGNIPTRENQNDMMVCDKSVWTRFTDEIAGMGLNMLVIDLGEGIKYKSHPEIAAPNAWSIEEIKYEIKRLKEKGVTCIPKLNFATSHSMWLGKYNYMIGTDTYYKVCKDLIDEVCEIFDYPEFFHLGMDEESHIFQTEKEYPLIMCRQGELWWYDTKYLIDCVEKNNVRAWLWCDMVFERNKEEFVRRMPKTVLLSYWMYVNDDIRFPGQDGYENENLACKNFNYLDKSGFEQIPCGSNWRSYENIELLARYCKNELSPKRLRGFMTAPWVTTTEHTWYYALNGAELLRQVKEFDF